MVVFTRRDQQGLILLIPHNRLHDVSIRLYLRETPRGLKFHCNNNCGEIAARDSAPEELSTVKSAVILIGSGQPAGILRGDNLKVAVHIHFTLSDGLFTLLGSSEPAE